jgi:hypothetical protein
MNLARGGISDKYFSKGRGTRQASSDLLLSGRDPQNGRGEGVSYYIERLLLTSDERRHSTFTLQRSFPYDKSLL